MGAAAGGVRGVFVVPGSTSGPDISPGGEKRADRVSVNQGGRGGRVESS